VPAACHEAEEKRMKILSNVNYRSHSAPRGAVRATQRGLRDGLIEQARLARLRLLDENERKETR
jgi:hypothetical protein